MSRVAICVGIGMAALISAGCVPYGWLYTGPNDPLPAPPAIDAAEQAELDQLLAAWDKKHAGLDTFACRFVRWQYDQVFGSAVKPQSTDSGSLCYSAPDKAAIQVEGDRPEHWTCDGTSLFEFDHLRKQLVEHSLPQQVRGRPIGDGPLPTPLIFAATSRQLKQRYYLRIVPPADELQHVWLAIYPRFQHDATVFRSATMILDRSTMRPMAVQVVTSDQYRTVYRFFDVVVDEPIDAATFRPATPEGWQHVADDAVALLPTAPGEPATLPQEPCR